MHDRIMFTLIGLVAATLVGCAAHPGTATPGTALAALPDRDAACCPACPECPDCCPVACTDLCTDGCTIECEGDRCVITCADGTRCVVTCEGGDCAACADLCAGCPRCAS